MASDPIDIAYPCVNCDTLLDPGPMPEKEIRPEVVCDCGTTNRWTSGVRDPVKFRWYPIFKCLVSWCKDDRHWMTPLCPEHWTGVPTQVGQSYWKAATGKPRMEIARKIASGVESGVWGHREPVNVSVTFRF